MLEPSPTIYPLTINLAAQPVTDSPELPATHSAGGTDDVAEAVVKKPETGRDSLAAEPVAVAAVDMIADAAAEIPVIAAVAVVAAPDNGEFLVDTGPSSSALTAELNLLAESVASVEVSVTEVGPAFETELQESGYSTHVHEDSESSASD